MFAKESFLRRLPVALSLEQRLQIDAFVYSTDAVSLAYDEIRRITRYWGGRVTEIDRRDRTAIFSWAWTIIDEVHVIRQLLKLILGRAFDDVPPNDYKNFYDTYECVNTLRNKMDHLSQNFKNLSALKSLPPPVFGVLSYALIQDSDVRIVDGHVIIDSGSIVAINSGTFTGSHSFQVINPLGRRLKLPVGLFQFSAFNEIVLFDELIEKLTDLSKALEDKIEQRCRKEAEKAAEKTGESVEKLMGNAIGDVVITMQFNAQSEGSAPEAEKR